MVFIISRAIYLLSVLSAISVISCGGGKKVPDSLPPESRIESAQEIKEFNSRLITQSSGAPASPADYLIGPADLLEVKVFESEKLTSAPPLSSSVQIAPSLMGSVDVKALPAREAEEK